jgi:hypothetical protein
MTSIKSNAACDFDAYTTAAIAAAQPLYQPDDYDFR